METQTEIYQPLIGLRDGLSVALCFDKNGQGEAISSYKVLLSKVLGRTDKSLNSEPHITFNGFKGEEREQKRTDRYLTHVCSFIKPFNIRLDRFAIFEQSNTIYLSLDRDSYVHVQRIMKSINQDWPGKVDEKNNTPHITIGKKFSPADFQIAKELLLDKMVNIELRCDYLTLRRIRWGEYQYQPIKIFKFLGLNHNLLF